MGRMLKHSIGLKSGVDGYSFIIAFDVICAEVLTNNRYHCCPHLFVLITQTLSNIFSISLFQLCVQSIALSQTVL